MYLSGIARLLACYAYLSLPLPTPHMHVYGLVPRRLAVGVEKELFLRSYHQAPGNEVDGYNMLLLPYLRVSKSHQ